MFRLLSVFVIACVAACGTTTQFTPTNPSPRQMQPRDPATVHVYSAGKPDVPYVEVGIIQARQSSEFSTHNMPEIIGEMRARAAEIGCDGVIINGANNTVVGHEDLIGPGSTDTLEGFWGACVMYEAPREAATTPPAGQ